jgi:hypothetical protein
VSNRYFGKLVRITDEYSVVMNRGEEHDVEVGQKFLLVGMGEVITDPDTGDELEQLEIVRGKVEVTHVQNKICTLNSYEYDKDSDVTEITKVRSGNGLASLLGPQNTVTESVKPGRSYLKKLLEPQVGDYAIKL